MNMEALEAITKSSKKKHLLSDQIANTIANRFYSL